MSPMSTFWGGLLAGLFIGTFLGIIIMSIPEIGRE